MKKNILFFLLGAILFSSLTALAASNGTLIEVFYNVDNIIVNGNTEMPEQKPFTYNDTTYVPLRYVAESLGYAIKWEDNIIYIEETPTEQDDLMEKDYQVDSSLISFSADHYAVSNKYTLYLELQDENYNNEYNGNYIQLPLNSHYKRFKGTLGLINDKKSTTGNTIINIYVDDILQYTKELEAGSNPSDIDIDIDVTNGGKIQFELVTVTRTDYTVDTEIGIFNGMLTE